jgi:hypothetical protein
VSARPSISTEERLSFRPDGFSEILIKIFQNQSEIADYIRSCEWETVLSEQLEQRLKQQVTKYFAFYDNINTRGRIPLYVHLQLDGYFTAHEATNLS